MYLLVGRCLRLCFCSRRLSSKYTCRSLSAYHPTNKHTQYRYEITVLHSARSKAVFSRGAAIRSRYHRCFRVSMFRNERVVNRIASWPTFPLLLCRRRGDFVYLDWRPKRAIGAQAAPNTVGVIDNGTQRRICAARMAEGCGGESIGTVGGGSLETAGRKHYNKCEVGRNGSRNCNSFSHETAPFKVQPKSETVRARQRGKGIPYRSACMYSGELIQAICRCEMLYTEGTYSIARSPCVCFCAV